MRPEADARDSATLLLPPPTPDVIVVAGVTRVRFREWIGLDVPLICARHHTIRGTRHVQRGAHRCYHREPEGRSSGPECGLYSYSVPVREIVRRFIIEVTFEEIASLDRMSEAGILAFFRAAWPTAA